MIRTADQIAEEGRALLIAGRTDQGLPLLQMARLQHPTHAGIARGLADALHASGKLPQSIAAYHAALRMDDTSADAWFGAGCAELSLKSFGAAAQSLGRAVSLVPNSGPARFNLAKAQFELGLCEQSVANFEQAARLDPKLATQAAENIATIIPGSPAASHKSVLRARQRWARMREKPAVAVNAAPAEARKLRLGYVSAFFGARNWMKPVYAAINRHDRERFEIHMFFDGDPPSAAAGYKDHDADFIHDLSGVANDQAARIIAGRGIDVLVDLNAYSFPSRLPMLMRRPAREIVGWFNHFATTGMAAFDWLVGDAAVIAPGEERHFTERIHRLPGSYLAFEVLYPVPEVAPPPCLERGFLTFGCLGSQYKLTGETLAAWARILHSAAKARLFLKNGTLSDDSVRAQLLGRLQALGIDPARITLEGRSEHYAFLERYAQVDIALDSFPYNGGTTTTEAMWQGVPVLAFDGERWASRTSKSLLLASGLGEWVATDESAYVSRAIALAGDPGTPEMLASLRSGMRARLAGSAACDAALLCRSLEDFYAAIAAKA